MKIRIYIIFFSFIIVPSFAQSKDNSIDIGAVISDTIIINHQIFEGILSPIQKSNNKIEIRYLISPSIGRKTLAVLTYNKKWEVTKYTFDGINQNLKYTKLDRNDLLDKFSKLVENNIFSLPDQSQLKLEKNHFNLETGQLQKEMMGVGDGTGYLIEFKVGNDYRIYGYHAPKAYANFFKLNSEIKQFANIVKIFGELLKE